MFLPEHLLELDGSISSKAISVLSKYFLNFRFYAVA